MCNFLFAHPLNSILNRTSSHDDIDNALKLIWGYPAESIRPSNQTFSNPIFLCDLVDVFIAGEYDAAPIGTKFKFVAEVSDQQVDVLEGLAMVEMGWDQLVGLFQLGENHDRYIIILQIFWQFLIKRLVYLNLLPVYRISDDLNLIILSLNISL